MAGSLENVLNWCSSFYNSEGCMNSEILLQIFRFSKTLFVCLSSYSLMRKCLPLLEYCGVMMNSYAELIKGYMSHIISTGAMNIVCWIIRIHELPCHIFILHIN